MGDVSTDRRTSSTGRRGRGMPTPRSPFPSLFHYAGGPVVVFRVGPGSLSRRIGCWDDPVFNFFHEPREARTLSAREEFLLLDALRGLNPTCERERKGARYLEL